MEFFKRLFGKSHTENEQVKNKPNATFPRYNYELELLDALNKTPTNKLFGINPYWEERYKELLGNLSPLLKKFLSQGLLEISLKEEVLKISELKKILKDNNLTQSGNKATLAKRVFEEVEDKSYAVNLIPFYKVTKKGQNEIQAYRKTLLNEFIQFHFDQAQLFLDNNLKELEFKHFRLRELHPDQRFLFGKYESFGDRSRILLKNIYLNGDFRLLWNFPQVFESRLRVLLAFKEIGIRFFEEFKNEYLKEIEMEEIYAHVQSNSEGFDFGSREDFLNNLIHFEYQNFWNQGKFQEIMDFKKRRPNLKFEGIQVLNDSCDCKGLYGEEKFTWDEITDLPTLPRHVKCRCIFNLM